MKATQPTLKQQSSVACPTCGVAAGKRCILVAGGLRNEPHSNRKLVAVEAPGKEKNQEAIMKSRATLRKEKERESDAAVLARLRKELAKPHFTKSVRENATKKQIASWNAG